MHPLPSPIVPQPPSELSSTAGVSPHQFSQLAQSGRRHPNSSEFAEDYIRRAIDHHEKGELEKATEYFRIAAEKNSPLGMFLYGISLRHGWGCHPNQVVAFQFLQKAAECAVFDLSNVTPDNPIVAKGELVLAIYELGICFRHGWGVPKNKVTAAYYFEIAANLGDPDAQADLAFCYAHGIGVKKDRYKAAKYYKMAHAQGISVFGNSWIFKDKYKHC
ncbi:HCP-like protein [Basidiobolus meristosporus CBS 931.73]|uniref:HCP-like protein n=1 Tax=Basidiobolus meristosporus CBS 931.73 TaxID=1314790 RepID=A0A1Y1YX93_9FUNG|nr:HCP-like protein [Basidiobolus meristosporus CBS 931.73]|eukprot:ORY02641.1 HCP-like protein [Basidiobolus meristosporus CBS 931.73]